MVVYNDGFHWGKDNSQLYPSSKATMNDGTVPLHRAQTDPMLPQQHAILGFGRGKDFGEPSTLSRQLPAIQDFPLQNIGPAVSAAWKFNMEVPNTSTDMERRSRVQYYFSATSSRNTSDASCRTIRAKAPPSTMVHCPLTGPRSRCWSWSHGWCRGAPSWFGYCYCRRGWNFCCLCRGILVVGVAIEPQYHQGILWVFWNGSFGWMMELWFRSEKLEYPEHVRRSQAKDSCMRNGMMIAKPYCVQTLSMWLLYQTYISSLKNADAAFDEMNSIGFHSYWLQAVA